MSTLSVTAQQIPTRDALVARARELAVGFRARAEQMEKERHLPEESIPEMVDAGFARILVPQEYGGYELGAVTWFEVVREIARGDASHGWCSSLMMHHAHYTSMFPEAAQKAVWENGPDTVIAASVAPATQVTAVDGGYRLTGKASFTSGVSGSSWVILGGLVHGDGPPEWMWFLVAPDQYEVEDTWFTSGMRGTGSNTVITDDIFVPTERTLVQNMLMKPSAPGATMHEAVFYRAPGAMYAPITFVTPMIGAAEAALESYVEWTRGRRVMTGQSVADQPHVQIKIGRISAAVECAESLVRRGAEAVDAGEFSDDLSARTVRNYTFAVELCLKAIDELMALSGAAGFALSNPIQRAWRDIHFASTHRAINPDANYALYGQYALGATTGQPPH